MQIHGNKSIQRLFFLILMLFTFAYAAETETETFTYAPEVKVLVSDREIVAGHIIRLKIRATGDKVSFPHIEQIDGVKVLEQHERVTNVFHYINGVLKKERTTLILTFAPHHDMTIPSYEVEIDGRKYKTKPIKIKVAEASAQNKEDNNKFLLHLRTDKKSVIVGEPILATVYLSLKHGVRLSDNPQYSKPTFKGFFAKELGDEKVYDEGHRQVTELRYLLTPLYEGNFIVGPASAKIGVADKIRRDMFGRFLKTRWISIASNTIDIEVKAKPQESDLVGSFAIENSLDTQSVKANKPVSLTVKIVGDGTLEEFEFQDFEIDGVTVYSDDAVITTDLIQNSIQSTYVKRFAFISDHDFTIPSRTISAYDTKSQTVKKLEVPSCDIKVEDTKMSTPTVQAAATSNAGKVQTSIQLPEISMLDGEEKIVEIKNVEWWTMILAFISGFLVMYLFKYLPSMKWKGKRGTIKEAEALKILYAHINESKEIEEMVRKLYARKNGDKNVSIDKKQLKEILEKLEIKN